MFVQDRKYPIGNEQSPSLELPATYDESYIKGKTILITGGASGFGEAFVRKWATIGACVVFGDKNARKGQALEREVRQQAGHGNVHFVFCDVTDWASQVNLFKDAIRLSPHHVIDTLVVNAGIADRKVEFENPVNLDVKDPPTPDLKVINVTLIGAMYTLHLGLFYLARNPNSSPASAQIIPSPTSRDRHILLIGSCASLMPLPGQALYVAAKHGVLGMYRSLRTCSSINGVRVNLICPYFVNTPMLTAQARAVLLAGAGLGTVEDVVEAATMFTANSSIVGRAVVIGPKLSITRDDEGLLSVSKGFEKDERANESGIWEIDAHDFEDCDVFSRNMIGLLNRAAEAKGWLGWAGDWVGAVGYGFSTWWKGKGR